MMEDLVNKLMERVNLDREKAEETVKTVTNFIQDKLPDPIAAQVSKALEGSSDALERLAGLAENLPGGVGEKLGGLLGGGDDTGSDA